MVMNRRYLLRGFFQGSAATMALPLLGGWVIWSWHRNRLSPRIAVTALAALVVLPLLIYLLTYLPFFIQKHSFPTFLELQSQMYYYHSQLKAQHPYASPWWSWPLDLHPLYAYTGSRSGLVAKIYAMGNPLLWWAGLGFMAMILWKGVRERYLPYLFLGTWYLGLWLPYAVSPRIMFIYHYLPASIFMLSGLGMVLADLLEERDSRKMAAAFLVMALVFFIYYYPHLTAWYVTPAWSHSYPLAR